MGLKMLKYVCFWQRVWAWNGSSTLRSQSLLPVWKGWFFAFRLMTLRLFTDQARPTLQMPCPRLNCRVQYDNGEHYDFVHAMVENSVPCALTPAEIESSWRRGTLRNVSEQEIGASVMCLHTCMWRMNCVYMVNCIYVVPGWWFPKLYNSVFWN